MKLAKPCCFKSVCAAIKRDKTSSVQPELTCLLAYLPMCDKYHVHVDHVSYTSCNVIKFYVCRFDSLPAVQLFMLCGLQILFKFNLFEKLCQEYHQSIKQFGSRSSPAFCRASMVWVQTVCKDYQQMTLGEDVTARSKKISGICGQSAQLQRLASLLNVYICATC